MWRLVATLRIDGSVRPQTIALAVGRTYPIGEVKSVRPCKDMTSQEFAKEYTIVIYGKETRLVTTG